MEDEDTLRLRRVARASIFLGFVIAVLTIATIHTIIITLAVAVIAVTVHVVVVIFIVTVVLIITTVVVVVAVLVITSPSPSLSLSLAAVRLASRSDPPCRKQERPATRQALPAPGR